jgi:hypothetical protein
MRIEFTRSGGFAGIRLNRTFDTSQMPEEDARQLEQLVDAANFFSLPETLQSGGADKLQYRISVERDGDTHTVQADERAAPPPLASLIEKLEAAARAR